MSSDSLSFTPVPRQSDRHDGWSPQKQQDFIAALADYGIVRAAAEKVGMGFASAYRLRSSKGGESFAAAWDHALKMGMMQLQDIAMDRVINGVVVDKFYKGEKVGETRWYDNRLLAFMLRQTNTRRFGAHASEWDFADEIMAVQAAREAERVAALAKAEALMEAINEAIESIDFEREGEDARDGLYEKRDQLDETIDRLRAANPVKAVKHLLTAADFRHCVSAGTLAQMNRQWGRSGP